MTNSKSLSALFLCLLTLACISSAWAGGLHLDGKRTTGFSWVVNDAAGFRWDIGPQGTVGDGSNDAYDTGMRLMVKGTHFSFNGQGKLSKDGREVEIGPWIVGTIRVHRRVYVNHKKGYCRWIDIFEDTSGKEVEVPIRYHTNMGSSVSAITTSSGNSALAEEDWGFVSGRPGSNSNRPALMHVFAAPKAKVRPRVEYGLNNDNIYYNFKLRIPAGRPVALCLFEAQRRPYTEVQKLLKEFRPAVELALLPNELRRAIVNMGGSWLMLESVELPRNVDHDLVVRPNGDELLGTILNDGFAVETFYGKIDLPAARVVGITAGNKDSDRTRVILTDGQVLAGKLLNGPLRIRLANGSEMSLSAAEFGSAAFKPSPQRPEKLSLASAFLALRDGQRLRVSPGNLDCTFLSQYGSIVLHKDDLEAIHFDTPEAGLHRAVFVNGSVLSGLLLASDLDVPLALGSRLAIPRQLLRRIQFNPSDASVEPCASLTLRNENRLRGAVAQDVLRVKTPQESLIIDTQDIATIRMLDNGFKRAQIKLHDGTTITGTVEDTTVRFQIQPGPELPVSVGHIVEITCPKPPAVPAVSKTVETVSPSRPATQPANK